MLQFALPFAQAALDIGGALKKRGKKAVARTLDFKIPKYAKAKYDESNVDQLQGIYSRRANGQDVGYSPDDLSTMNAEAIDSSARESKDLLARSMAGRRTTGGVTTGGVSSIRDAATRVGLEARSKAMRDIAISNAVLKRKEQSEGISGLHDFMNDNRTEQHRIFADDTTSAKMENDAMIYNAGEADKVEGYNRARSEAGSDLAFGAANEVMMGMGGSSNPFGKIGQLLKKRTLSSYR